MKSSGEASLDEHDDQVPISSGPSTQEVCSSMQEVSSASTFVDGFSGSDGAIGEVELGISTKDLGKNP